MLMWLKADCGPDSVAQFTKKIDAVIEFSIFVASEFLASNYRLEKHWSDVYDQFQLHYLAIEGAVIVTADSDLLTRARHSAQANQIVSFGDFVKMAK